MRWPSGARLEGASSSRRTVLLEALLEAARVRGYARLVVRPAPEAVRFYGRAGFAVADGGEGEKLLVRSLVDDS